MKRFLSMMGLLLLNQAAFGHFEAMAAHVEASSTAKECLLMVTADARPSNFQQWLLQAPDGKRLSKTNSRLPVLVIGAGPAGLAAMKELKERGIPFEGVDRNLYLGGMWSPTNNNSPVYDSLMTDSSAATTYLDERRPRSRNGFLTREEALNYLVEYAARHDLPTHIRFHSDVKRVRKTSDCWTVEFYDDRDGIHSKEYRAVVIANGKHSKLNAYIPEDLARGARASGQYFIHSSDYRNANYYAGKNVLVVGIGNSGADIVTEVSKVARRTVLAVRTPPWIVPLRVLGKPADKFAQSSPRWIPHWLEMLSFHLLQRWYVGHPSRVGFESPEHGLLDKLPIVDRGIVKQIREGRIIIHSNVDKIENGIVSFEAEDEAAEKFDAIIFATGYRHQYPFLEDRYWPSAEHLLQFMIFHPQERGLIFMEEPITTQGAWPLQAAQARSIATYLKAEQGFGSAVRRFDGMRSALSPDFKGRILSAEGNNFVDPRLYMEFLEHFDRWIQGQPAPSGWVGILPPGPPGM